MAFTRTPQAVRAISFLFLLTVAVLCASASGKVIYVDDDADGASDGTSWSNAYVYLQDALVDANDSPKPVEIRVAQGTYKPDQGVNQVGGDRKAAFELRNGVTVKGGFAGCGEGDPNAWDPNVFSTILSGDLGGDDGPNFFCYHENSYHVVTCIECDMSAELEALTISSGNATDRIGGGMFNYSASPTLKRCVFSGNQAAQGGGMANRYSSPTVSNCTFDRNRGTYDGGGIYNENGHPIVTNCQFMGNIADSQGGGLYVGERTSPKLSGCTFSENWAGHAGGAVYCDEDSEPLILRCVIRANRTEYIGGGICCDDDSNPRIEHCDIMGNSGRLAGGICCNNDSAPTILNCQIIGNTAEIEGGGIYWDWDSAVTVDKCLIIGNVATYGGGVYGQHSSPHLRNCTISGNSAQYGGGIYCWDSSPNLLNCILWGDASEEVSTSGGLPVISYSNVEGGWPGAANISVDPLFANPGCWVDVYDPNIIAEANDPNAVCVDGDYHLRSEAGRWDTAGQMWVMDAVTSPCIDTGDPNSAVASEPFPNGGIVNMGAYGSTGQASKSRAGQHAKYSGGTGEPNNPYQIATAADLIALGETPDDYDKHFVLTADIDLDPNLPERETFHKAPITYLRGFFDGSGHNISHLAGPQGLFGKIGTNAVVCDLGVVAVNIVGTGSCVGGLAGFNAGGIIRNCYTTGVVSGNNSVAGLVGENGSNNARVVNCSSACIVIGSGGSVGGLVGENDCEVTSCFSYSTVSGSFDVGGLVGQNEGHVTHCYSTGNVSGLRNIGGLVGDNADSDDPGVVADCFSTGLVNGGVVVGGLVGRNGGDDHEWAGALGQILRSYSIAKPLGSEFVGGLVGKTEWGTTETSFWNVESSGQLTSAGGTGLSATEMQDIQSYLNSGWDFAGETENGTDDTWLMSAQGYPLLGIFVGSGTINDPYRISVAEQLIAIGADANLRDKFFVLMNDVDLDPNLPGRCVFTQAVIPEFSGTFDGQNFHIRNLTISGDTSYLGLIGLIRYGGSVTHLGLESVRVDGFAHTAGALVAKIERGSVSHCHSAGTVAGGGPGGWTRG